MKPADERTEGQIQMQADFIIMRSFVLFRKDRWLYRHESLA
jgi:hypothetical protein